MPSFGVAWKKTRIRGCLLLPDAHKQGTARSGFRRAEFARRSGARVAGGQRRQLEPMRKRAAAHASRVFRGCWETGYILRIVV